jgi:hypothetical protein
VGKGIFCWKIFLTLAVFRTGFPVSVGTLSQRVPSYDRKSTT